MWSLLAVLLPSVLPSSQLSKDEGSKPPNILFIMADDLGFNDVDWKDPTLHTPTLQKLAFHKNSALLTNSYVNQLCTPTRSAFMTGYYPFRVGTQVFVMEPSGVPEMFPFLPENLKTLNYSSYLIGKWHLGYCKKEYLPTSRGFDYFYGFYGPQTGYFNHSADQFHRDKRRVVRGLDLFEEVSKGASVPDFTQNGVYSTDLFTDGAINMMDYHDKTKPFFMFLSYQSVHPPLQVPREYEQLCMQIKNRARRTYCGMLASMDAGIARVLEYLKSTGLYEETVIVFTSDNGGMVEFGASNFPLRGEKDTIWEGGTKTTTFVHSPKYIKNGGSRDLFFHVVDWHATLLAVAGMNIKTYGDGINQWQYITTNNPETRRFQFVYNIDTHGSAIRDGDFKLIEGNPERKLKGDKNKVRLFRISVDPRETNDISRSFPKVVKRLLNKIIALKKYLHKNVRKPLSDLGNPEHFNGTYSSFWCH